MRDCVSLKKNKSQGRAVDETVNSKEENSKDFCLDFVQEFGLWLPASVSFWNQSGSLHGGTFSVA
jgi:hypothetical protein